MENVLGTISVKNDGVILGNGDVFGDTEGSLNLLGTRSNAFKSDASLFADEFSSSEDSDVLKDGLSVVSEGGSLHSADLQVVLEPVEDQASQELTLDVFGNDQKGFLLLVGQLKERQDIPNVAELLLDNEDVAVLELDLLLLLVSHEVRRNVSPVELETINELNLVVKGLTFLDSDGSMDSHLLVEISKHVADTPITVG